MNLIYKKNFFYKNNKKMKLEDCSNFCYDFFFFFLISYFFFISYIEINESILLTL